MILAHRKTLNDGQYNTLHGWRKVSGEARPVTTLEHAQAREADYDAVVSWLESDAKKSWREQIVDEECRKDEIPVVKAPRCDCAIYTGCFFERNGAGYNIFTCDKHEWEYLMKRGDERHAE